MNTENMTVTTTEIKVNIPEGMMVDEEKSTFTRIILKQKPQKIQWEDFGQVKGYFVNSDSHHTYYVHSKAHQNNKNTWPTEQEAKASVALSQLCQWRDKYNEGWSPDFTNLMNSCYIIYHNGSSFIRSSSTLTFPTIFRFKDAATRDKFYEDFKDLLEEAKPLLT